MCKKTANELKLLLCILLRISFIFDNCISLCPGSNARGLSDRNYSCIAEIHGTPAAGEPERLARGSTLLPLLLLKCYGLGFISSVKTSEAVEPGQVHDWKSI